MAILLPALARASDWQGPVIGKSAAVADIRLALARAEAIHPNLYWHASRDLVRQRETAVLDALPDDARPMDVYLGLRELVGMLGDGHIQVSAGRLAGNDLFADARQATARFLAITAAPALDGLRVLGSRTDGVRAGDTIATINGQSAVRLFERMIRLEPGEPAFQREEAQAEFPWLLWDFSIRPPFVLDGRFGGRAVRISVVGSTMQQAATHQPAPDTEDGLRLTTTPGPFSVITFTDMTASPERFVERLAAIVAAIWRQNPIGLIIDVRHNDGGNSLLGDRLLSFFNTKPYRPFAKEVVKMSPECRKAFPPEDWGRDAPVIKLMRDGEMHEWEVPVRTPRSNPLRYRGPVAVLIGPGTFSSANIFANAIGDFHLATLVGRDTAEIPNNYGMPCPTHLPGANLDLSVPCAYFERASGDAGNMQDVQPDIAVTPGPDDGPDPDMAAAQRWLRAQGRSR